MSIYNPDKWIVVHITGKNIPPIDKVFACWYGGYAGADSWKLNSGITKVTLEGNIYSFEGYSGSVYVCHKDCYGTNMYGSGVLETMTENAKKKGISIEILPEGTDFLHLDFNHKKDEI
jgi:hypothetical protein